MRSTPGIPTHTIPRAIDVYKRQVYDIAIMLAGGSQGKLSNSASVLVYYIYENAFDYWKLGYASAVAMVLFVLVLAVTIIQFAYEKKLED